MHQLRERRLTFAGYCYRCEDQPVKHLVLWKGRAGRMLRGQANRLTYVKQLLRDSCCETVDELQRTMKNRAEWARISPTTSSSEWLRSLRKLMDLKFMYVGHRVKVRVTGDNEACLCVPCPVCRSIPGVKVHAWWHWS